MENKDLKIKKTRNYGIDLLRFIAMLMVVEGHLIGHGGVSGHTIVGSIEYICSTGISVFTVGAINIFAIISGYVGYKEGSDRINMTALIRLWFMVVFWTISITLISVMIGIVDWDSKLQRLTFFPILSKTYWYMTGHFVVLFCSSLFLNRLIRWIPMYLEVVGVIAGMIILSVLITTSGNNSIWLIQEYCIGAIIKKSRLIERINAKTCIVIFVVCNMISFLMVYSQELNFVVWNKFFWGLCGGRIGGLWPSGLLINIASVVIVVGFINFKPSQKVIGYLEKYTSYVLACYLIQVHPVLWGLMEGKYVFFSHNAFTMVLGTLFASIMTMAVCIVMEKMRQRLGELVVSRVFRKLVCRLQGREVSQQ